MYRVFGDIYSGNCYKIKLLLSFLDIQHEWVHVNILQQETHSDAFHAKNPNERIPVLEVAEGQYLWESNAILHFLADGTDFLPGDRFLRAQVLQWQCFEQYSHEPYIATARYIKKYLGLPPEREAEFQAKQPGGYKALAVMDEHLSRQSFFVGKQVSIADIALYAYTHVADEGGFDLQPFPNIQRWLRDFGQCKGYQTMDEYHQQAN